MDVYDLLEGYGGVGGSGSHGRHSESDDHGRLGLEHPAAIRYLLSHPRAPVAMRRVAMEGENGDEYQCFMTIRYDPAIKFILFTDAINLISRPIPGSLGHRLDGSTPTLPQ